MTNIGFPKSVRDSQRFIAWAFPGLIAYGIISIPGSSPEQLISILLGLIIVVTGWQSFGVVDEDIYNDLLLIADLALLSTYWLFLYYGRRVGPESSSVGVLLNLSGTICFLYGVWDVAALAGRDTSALATAAHLKRFAWLTFALGLFFFGLGIIATRRDLSSFVPPFAVQTLGLGVWAALLLFWQVGRWIAALHDGRSDK